MIRVFREYLQIVCVVSLLFSIGLFGVLPPNETARALSLISQPDITQSSSRIEAPAIGLSTAYQGVGVTIHGAVEVPESTVGRWVGSAAPGEDGAGFYSGHTPGVFKNLARLSVGDAIIITVDEVAYHYRVAYSEQVSYYDVDMKKALRVYGGAQSGATLMTCAGKYSQSLGTYDARLIIYIVQTPHVP